MYHRYVHTTIYYFAVHPRESSIFFSAFDNITEGRDIYNRMINTNTTNTTTTGYALRKLLLLSQFLCDCYMTDSSNVYFGGNPSLVFPFCFFLRKSNKWDSENTAALFNEEISNTWMIYIPKHDTPLQASGWTEGWWVMGVHQFY